MRKLANFLVASVGLIGTSAFAADMAVKAPPPAPAPVYNWTGWYVGGNVGYSWGRAKTDVAGNGTLDTFINAATTENFGFADSNTAHLNGVIGGGQIGYNYQFGTNWVFGLEADIQAPGERGSGQFADTFVNTTPFASTNTFLTGYQAKIDWFGTVRARLGVLSGDQFLIYATGGLAYGKVGISGNTSANVSFGAMTASTAFSNSATNVGFAVGAGVEGKLSYWLPPNWTWKLEYLYLDLGSVDTTASFATSSSLIAFTSAAGNLTTHTHFTDNIVRAGLNYQFH